MARKPEYPNPVFERLMNNRVIQEDRFNLGDWARVNDGARAGSVDVVARIWLEENRFYVLVLIEGKPFNCLARELSNITEAIICKGGVRCCDRPPTWLADGLTT